MWKIRIGTVWESWKWFFLLRVCSMLHVDQELTVVRRAIMISNAGEDNMLGEL